ncbi:MAG: hypothetical protein WBV90_03465 [Terrimicrobiaceae bacterium]
MILQTEGPWLVEALTLPAGAIADIVNRRTVIVVAASVFLQAARGQPACRPVRTPSPPTADESSVWRAIRGRIRIGW